MENFVHLHLHSRYSAYDGVSSCQQLVDQAVEHGHQAIALTNHGLGSMGDLLTFQQYAKSKGVKPVLGNEAYLVEELVTTDGKKRKRTKNTHIILLAKNETGWKNLCHLSYIANIDEEHFYYKPRNTFEELFRYKEGLVCGTACLASIFSTYLLAGKPEKAEEYFRRFHDEFGEDFYAEIQLNELFEEQKKYDDWIIEMGKKYNVPVVVTGDVHYARPEDAFTQRFVFNLRKAEDSEGDDTYKCKSLYYQGIEDFKSFNKKWGYGYVDEQIDEWCANSARIAEKCDYEIPLGTGMKLPRYSFNEEEDFVAFAKKGLSEHFKCSYKGCPEEYRKRLEYELEILLKKGAYRYMLTVASFVKHAKEKGFMVGPSRGSCFLPDTIVQGKKIKDYKQGDKITTGLIKQKTIVEKVFSFDREEKIAVIKTVENKTIKCTKDHKILVLKKGLPKKIENCEFVDAKEIKPGDFLIKL